MIRFGWSDSSVTMFTPEVRADHLEDLLDIRVLEAEGHRLGVEKLLRRLLGVGIELGGGRLGGEHGRDLLLEGLGLGVLGIEPQGGLNLDPGGAPFLLRHPLASKLQTVLDFGRADDPLQPRQGQLVVPIVAQGAAVGGLGIFRAVNSLEVVALAHKILGGHPECPGETEAGLQVPRILFHRLLEERDRLFPSSLLGHFLAARDRELHGAARQQASQEKRQGQPSDLTDMRCLHGCASSRFNRASR